MWIEIGMSKEQVEDVESSPTRGMWIEISFCFVLIPHRSVIPHTGDVD